MFVQSAMAPPPTPPEAAKEIEFVKGLVARHFPVYDVRVNYDAVQFFCRVDESTLEDQFERLREDMAPHGYIPMITYDKGEHVILVAKKPPAKYRSIYVNMVMLVVTFLAMMFAGILDWSSYADVPSDQMFSADTILTGIVVFTLPLMAILGVHELGHFFMARKRKVAASLPFFIPSIPPLGTFGAFISLRDPIPNRKSLLEIGIAGPLAGLAVAIPIGIIGLMLTNMEARPVPEDFGEGGLVRVSFPMIYLWLENLVPIQGDYLLHPTAFAAWVGFLVTALNLLPAGQLDGGHIARALLGKNAKYASWVTIAALVGISMFYWSWMLFAILILFLGARHPPPLNDITKLDTKRKGLGIFAFVVLIIAFVPVPMTPVDVDHSFVLSPVDATNATIEPGDAVVLSLYLENLGNMKNNLTLDTSKAPYGWNVTFKQDWENDSAYSDAYAIRLNSTVNVTMDVRIASSTEAPEGVSNVTVKAVSEALADDPSLDQKVTFTFNVTYPNLTFWVQDDDLSIPAGSEAAATVQVNNSRLADANLTLHVRDLPAYVGAVLFLESPSEEGISGQMNLSVPAQGNETFGVQILVWSSAEPGEKIVLVDVFFSDALMATIEIILTVT